MRATRGEVRPDFQSPGRLSKDLKPIVEKWVQAGIKVVYTGIDPWERDSGLDDDW